MSWSTVYSVQIIMVQKYKMKMSRANFTDEEIEDAAKKVLEENRSIHSVAKIYGIDHCTLSQYVRKGGKERQLDTRSGLPCKYLALSKRMN